MAETDIPSISELAMHGRDAPAADDSKHMVRKRRFAALERHLRQSPTMRALYEPYLSLARKIELPVLSVENQPEGAFSNFAERELTDISNDTFWAVREQDKQLKDTDAFQRKVLDLANSSDAAHVEGLPDVNPQLDRACLFAQKKWLLAHDGSVGTRTERKAECERTSMQVFEVYRNTYALRSFIGDVKAARLNRHDMMDAFQQGMATALQIYARLAAKVMPRRRPHEVRSDTPELLDVWRTNTGTIRVLAVDPGLRNIGVCLIELVRMQLPVANASGTCTPLLRGAAHEPEPHFRVLLMELLDLDTPWSDLRGHAVASFVPLAQSVPSVMEPDYSNTRDIKDYFLPTAAPQAVATDDGFVKAAPNKRKRPAAAAPRPRKKQKTDGGVTIDLTEDKA